MDKHTCKLCFRRFHNGRALGGHMRSHVLAAAGGGNDYSRSPPQQSPPISLASTASTEIEVDGGGKKAQGKVATSYVLRENPKRSYKAKFSGGGGGAVAGGESSVVQDGQSDTESPRGGAGFAVSRRRSKRPRPPQAAVADPEPASSVSDATPEEDVAMSLVMLSRDSWTRSRSEHEPHWAPASSEAEQNNDSVNVFDEDEHSRRVAGGECYDEEYGAAARPRHQCGVCKKAFRSYQALGGHRASIKKGKGGCVPPPTRPSAPGNASRAAAGAPVIHECPFCFRVFDSGQVLGGHKRAHMSSTPSPSPAKCGDGDSSVCIDLNVPAEMEDDFELSAVYDAEFGSTRQY